MDFKIMLSLRVYYDLYGLYVLSRFTSTDAVTSVTRLGDLKSSWQNIFSQK